MIGLYEANGIACNPNEWLLFVDSSSRKLKDVLLHKENMYTSIPQAHSVQFEEEYSNANILLDALN